ncbi:MAG: hypothetical protein WDZ85_00685 [Candidatus Paceibacterota bacterium]
MEIRKYNQQDEEQVKSIFAQYWTDPEFLSELSENLNSTEEEKGEKEKREKRGQEHFL